MPRIQFDPSLLECPDFASPTFAAARAPFVNPTTTEEQAIQLRSKDHSGEIPSRTRHSNSECYSNHAFWTSLRHGSNGLVHCSQNHWPERSHQWSIPIFLPNSKCCSDSVPSSHLQHCSISGSGAERESPTPSNPRKPCSDGYWH